MSDHATLEALARALVNAPEWSSDTLDSVSDILATAGYLTSDDDGMAALGPAVSTCEHTWRAAESGYVRTWSIERHDDGTLTAHYSGASDFSDDGDGDVYLECRTCLTREAIPAGTVMDWE